MRCGLWGIGGGGDCESLPVTQRAPDWAEETGRTVSSSLAGCKGADRGSATPEKTESQLTGEGRDRIT